MAEDTYPDGEGALRTYLRADTGVVAVASTRVFFGIPDEPTFPLVTVARVGGGDDPSDACIDLGLYQVDCWGAFFDEVDETKAHHGDKATCDSLRRAVRAALRAITNTTVGSTFLYGATVQSDVALSDPADGRPRYSQTVLVTARST